MLDSITNRDETECEVLVNKYISMGYDIMKIKERLKMVDEKFNFIYNFPLKNN